MRKIEALLLGAAAEIPDAVERALFLEWACRDNETLRSRVAGLLDSHSSAERFFDFEPFDSCTGEEVPQATAPGPEDSVEIGLRIGRYRLLSVLGEGGGGVVYLAEQETPIHRRVALKLIRVGLHHDQVIARFEAERQSLAMMDHPGIARVLDAGATPTGRPYFVMEWVTGEKITNFCDKHRLMIRRRLELFIKVCNAVQHAHQKGIIHRDLKPSNILTAFYDDAPQPKIIDFGIAKAAIATESGTADESGGVLGTPDYMSPEQATCGGLDVDTRSDIFSLGVILCELLTGTTPSHPNGCPVGSAATDTPFSSDLPPAPSRVFAARPPGEQQAAAAARSCVPSRLAAILAGDLDAIVGKCLEPDRHLRYATASGLAIDVQRHLQDEPVAARPAHRGYLLGRLIRRNRFAFSIAALTFVLLAAGLGTSSWLFFRETVARRDAETARAAEIRLRQIAEVGELCAKAAVRVSYGKLEEADRLVAGVSDGMVTSSLEAAQTFEKLGYWHLQAGRYPEAAARFTSLVESQTRVDPTDSVSVSTGTLLALGAVCRAADWQRYNHILHVSLDRFAHTSDANVAEQILKLGTIRPPDPAVLDALSTAADVVRKAVPAEASQDPNFRNLESWYGFSLALWTYRGGEYAQALEWTRRALITDDLNTARIASSTIVQAMALCHLGRHDEALERLARAANTTRAALSGPGQPPSSSTGAWWDWAVAGVLLDEAESLIRPER